MNTQNYASLEASKRLHDAGIELETDFVWRLGADGWKLLTKDWVRDMMSNTYESLPAPSMTEVLEELPNNTAFLKNKVYYASVGGSDNEYKEFVGANPTDALIDLLIFVKQQQQKRERTIKKLIDQADKLKW